MRVLSGIAAVLFIVASAAVYFSWPAPPAKNSLSIGGDFILTHESGQPKNTATLFEGRPMLVYFGYTFCPDVCPTTLIDMVVAAEESASVPALVFVSIDPERDSPQTLAAHTDLFSPHLHGFTGAKAELEQVKASWAVFAAKHEDESFTEYLMDHTTLVFLTNAAHEVIGTFKNGTSSSEMARSIDRLLASAS